ncbi:MAG: S1C family serine protease [Hyphomicrobiales bacterium]
MTHPRSAALFAAILVAFSAALAGCDSGDDNDNNATATATASQPASPAASTSGGEQSAVAGVRGSIADIASASVPSVVRVGVGCQGGNSQQCAGVGSGWLFDDNGNFVTNNHVVALGGQRGTARQVILTTVDGRDIPATVVGTDERTDLAVVRADDPAALEGMNPFQLADSRAARIGDPVIAIGFALDLGISPSVTTGVLSAKERQVLEPSTALFGVLQTDAAINPGNSGGPLLDATGKVLGVNTAGAEGAQGIGFAVSSKTVEAVAGQILAKGHVDRGFLGIGFEDVTPGLADQLKVPVKQGVVIEQVAPASPADRAGLQPNDVITKIGDMDIQSSGDVPLALLQSAPGEQIAVEYFRGPDQHTAQVTLGEPPELP